MCVAVTLQPGAELTEEEIYKMGNANGDGFGFAWAEDGVVHWWKSIEYNVEYFHHLVRSLKEFPRFVHFRLATIGGVRVDLCHPFEIGPMAACQERGHGNKVMMHNGHWYRSGEIFDILKREQALPDNGPWSDTRVAALMAAQDEDWLTVVTGRVATLDGAGNMRLLGSWDKLRDGILVSNKGWDHEYNYRRTGAGRRWEGWGWNEKNWLEKEKHDKEKEKEREEAEKKEKENGSKKKESGKNEQKGTMDTGAHRGGDRDLGVRPGDRQLPQARGGSIDWDHEKEREKRIEKARAGYNYRPWRNPATGEWWQVDRERVTEYSHGVRRLTEAEAAAIMEQIAATPGQTESGSS